jgi:hypothetical protein
MSIRTIIGPRKVAKYNLQGHVKAVSACHQYMGLVTITEASQASVKPDQGNWNGIDHLVRRACQTARTGYGETRLYFTLRVLMIATLSKLLLRLISIFRDFGIAPTLSIHTGEVPHSKEKL